jgi:hypothetical protein
MDRNQLVKAFIRIIQDYDLTARQDVELAEKLADIVLAEEPPHERWVSSYE